MENVVLPVLAGILIEALVFYADLFQHVWNGRNDEDGATLEWRVIASLFGGVLFAVLFGHNFFAEYTATLPVVPQLLSGIIIARLSNFAHDAMSK